MLLLYPVMQSHRLLMLHAARVICYVDFRSTFRYICLATSLQGKRMHMATMWLGISGLAFMAMLLSRHVKGAIMIGEQQSQGHSEAHMRMQCMLCLSLNIASG
jgi:hypothetical protein